MLIIMIINVIVMITIVINGECNMQCASKTQDNKNVRITGIYT